MIRDRGHLIHLIYLFLGLCFSFFLFITLQYDPLYQFFAIALGVLYYIVWGCLHHYFMDRLSFHVALEYILVGSVVLLLLALVLGIG